MRLLTALILLALDSAYRIRHITIDSLVANWPRTRGRIP